MTSQETATAVSVGYDEDNWEKTKSQEANADCPGGNPFVYIPSIINGKKIDTKWWTNYWWGMNEYKKGTYVWGGGQFDSCFDPKKFYEQTSDGLKLKAFYDNNRINPDDHKNYPSWVTSELVMGGLDGNDYNHPGYGFSAVVVKTDDFGKFDPHVVLGIFTYQFGQAANPDDGRSCANLHREIDLLETISTAEQGLKGNAQFALQPASNLPKPDGTSLHRFTIPEGTPVITAYMGWAPIGITATQLKIFAGDRHLAELMSDPPPPCLAEWVVNPSDNLYKNVPKHKNERMHINLYVPKGNHGAADRNKAHEVYVKRFEFAPW
jgi:hypothetical protein